LDHLMQGLGPVISIAKVQKPDQRPRKQPSFTMSSLATSRGKSSFQAVHNLGTLLCVLSIVDTSMHIRCDAYLNIME
jgi:hypothetical protein